MVAPVPCIIIEQSFKLFISRQILVSRWCFLQRPSHLCNTLNLRCLWKHLGAAPSLCSAFMHWAPCCVTALPCYCATVLLDLMPAVFASNFCVCANTWADMLLHWYCFKQPVSRVTIVSPIALHCFAMWTLYSVQWPVGCGCAKKY